MTYAERRSTTLPATVRVAGRTSEADTDVLPDGCTDVIWDGGSLVVAGPDTRPHRVAPSTERSAAIRSDASVVLEALVADLCPDRAAPSWVAPAGCSLGQPVVGSGA